MKCVILSGATIPFTELIQAVDTSLANKLVEEGFTELYVQYGYAKDAFNPPSNPALKIVGFDFTPEIKQLARSADLVISHAGSGSILDSLERGGGNAKRRVIVVVNTKLMDNHQLELAQKLEQLGCISVAKSPEELVDAVDVAYKRQYAQLQESNSIQYIVDSERDKK